MLPDMSSSLMKVNQKDRNKFGNMVAANCIYIFKLLHFRE